MCVLTVVTGVVVDTRGSGIRTLEQLAGALFTPRIWRAVWSVARG